jgi:hypothetical protein
VTRQLSRCPSPNCYPVRMPLKSATLKKRKLRRKPGDQNVTMLHCAENHTMESSVGTAFVSSGWKIRRGQPGRPTLPCEVRDLIRRMCRENPTWAHPASMGNCSSLASTSVRASKYMVRCRKPPSQTWRTFLENHARQLVSIDFFTVPTIRFQVLYVFLVLAHDRRRVLHFHVTAHPTAEWTGQPRRPP